MDHKYNETVVIIPRNFPISFRCNGRIAQHHAIIGMATVSDGYPLLYDATNEFGLSIAGLNFPDNAVYYPEDKRKINIAPFELIPWLLSQCKTVNQAAALLENINIAEIPFNENFPLTPLHWIVSDKNKSITVESVADGLKIHENPIGVLANNPVFPFHMYNLSNYLNLTREIPENRFSDKIQLEKNSLGMGAIGLPGDLSSSSRFVRAAFTKLNSVCNQSEESSISQFFHILDTVAQTDGCCATENGFEKTIYSSCCNTDKGIYYYTTYENRQITAVNMFHEDLDRDSLYAFPLIQTQNVRFVQQHCG